jgi:uncharacterized protein YegJ (DUF2314 family)
VVLPLYTGSTMADHHDFPLPLHPAEHAETRASIWDLEQEPTQLIAFWPGEAPTQTEVLAGLAAMHGDSLSPQDVDHEPPVLWSVAITLPGIEKPVILWSEPAQPVPPGEFEDPRAEQAQWVIGLQVLLDPDDPLSEFITLLKTVHGGLPESLGVLDTNTTHYHSRAQLQELVGGPVEPSAEILWTIHCIGDPRNNDGTGWLHTHGLQRCGRPELEMLDVPLSSGSAAGHMLNHIAQRVLEEFVPEPGEPFEVGTGMTVTFQPWQTIVAQPLDLRCGGKVDREGSSGEAHNGVRAVVCDSEPRGVFRKLWTWPETAIRQWESGQCVLYLTNRATKRQAAQAQLSWPEFATAFATCAALPRRVASQPNAAFVVKAGFEKNLPDSSDDDSAREHLWFEVQSIDGDRAHGELLNQPVAVDLNQGEIVSIARTQLSDWKVQMPQCLFGPQSIKAMWHAIDQLRSGT